MIQARAQSHHSLAFRVIRSIRVIRGNLFPFEERQ
jgi:hypothetical protein